MTAKATIELEGLKKFKSGKVRDIYEVAGDLLIVASDRISAFDHILPTLIPDKGRILTALSLFWFDFTSDIVKSHLITASVQEFPEDVRAHAAEIEGRAMLVRKSEVMPVECVARGYLAGSGWKEYEESQSVCGHKLVKGLSEAAELSEPIFTPATKAESGHDINITIGDVENMVGKETARKLEENTIKIYKKARDYAKKRGIIIADTKFEFGLRDGEMILVDEILTPDSSRFWPMSEYAPGR